ncbi:MAG: hypothetical protein KY450_00425 [Actinobacteria bacterium]|nr:hypothetical protein [Actinomycetota bacterium]
MFWGSAAAGWAVIAWGVWGAVGQHVDTRPADLVRLVVGGILVHDLVVVPLALLGTWVVARVVPARGRRWVQAALVATAPLALFAYPMVRGFGRLPDNPTALPHHYAANLALVTSAVALAVAAVAAVDALRRRR